jgi:hypothetical protein
MMQRFLLNLNILLKSADHDVPIISEFKYFIKTKLS